MNPDEIAVLLRADDARSVVQATSCPTCGAAPFTDCTVVLVERAANLAACRVHLARFEVWSRMRRDN